MSRYSSAAAEVSRLAARPFTGAAIVLTAPGEQAAVSEAIRERVAFDQTSLSGVTGLHHEPFRRIVPGLGPHGPERTAQIELLNSRRGWFSTHDQRVILVVDLQEMMALQRHAADLFSTRPFFVNVPFVPDPTVDVEEARASLGRWLWDRFGKLDMRGLIRRESQDVAFSVEELYQELEGRKWAAGLVGSGNVRAIKARLAGIRPRPRPVVAWLKAAVRARRTVVLIGGPGSGKTFFLRWLALMAARLERPLGIEHPLPLLVSVAAFARAPEPVSLLGHIVDGLLREGLSAAHIVERALGTGTAIVLIDGLDEVANAGHRERVVNEVGVLRRAFPECLFVITSRPVGYSGLGDLPRSEVELVPFKGPQIRRFLESWSLLYARERLGPGAAAEKSGREEGEQLVHGVLSNLGVRDLAKTPLLLTVIAVVHRAGVRLPDHRVELYDHVTQVLVERWNRVRGLTTEHGAAPPPLKAVDAVRLLGPLALRMVGSGVQSNITEEELRKDLAAALETGALHGLATVDEAVAIFRDTLGLLVEVGPGLFAFLHLTLAEYFAAWELARSDALEKLLADPKKVFAPQYREALLLAAGVLGLLRGDDQRLAAMIEKISQAASMWEGEPSSDVPALMADILKDDANLGTAQIGRLLDALVPAWWFRRFDERAATRQTGQQSGRVVDFELSMTTLHAEGTAMALRSKPAGILLRHRLERCRTDTDAYTGMLRHLDEGRLDTD